MKKILIAIDALKPKMNAIDFACYLGRLTKSKITGVFLENFIEESRLVLRKDYRATYIDYEVDENSQEHQQKIKLIKKSISRFEQACATREVNCEIYQDTEVPYEDIIAETRFADLLVVDAETSFDKKYDGIPTGFIKKVCEEAECPVIISPETFESIDNVIFCYDGSPSSFFSIKQFNYLLPELKNKKVTVVEVNAEKKITTHQKMKVKEWLALHYNEVCFEILQGNAKDELFSYLLPKKNAIVVMGSYGRTPLSLLFKKSTADLILKTTDLPLFITHH